MDIISLYRNHGIHFLTEGHKHCRPGWVNTPCPYCSGNTGMHLGFEADQGYYYCWRCGWHPIVGTIAKMMNISEQEAYGIIKPYELLTSKIKVHKPKQELFKLPSNVGPLEKKHKTYLTKRGFDPEELIHYWDVMGTGPISLLDKIHYGHRILAPVYWQGQRVTFQTRDITNRSLTKYLACPKHREKIHHKHILYGKEEAWTQTGICVEGITDVWKIGGEAFCTFGIEFTNRQLRAIADTFDRVAIVFDPDPQAIIQANKLKAELGFRGVDAWIVSITNDPGSMKPQQIKELKAKIL
jgi:hypothetical protein